MHLTKDPAKEDRLGVCSSEKRDPLRFLTSELPSLGQARKSSPKCSKRSAPQILPHQTSALLSPHLLPSLILQLRLDLSTTRIKFTWFVISAVETKYTTDMLSTVEALMAQHEATCGKNLKALVCEANMMKEAQEKRPLVGFVQQLSTRI